MISNYYLLGAVLAVMLLIVFGASWFLKRRAPKMDQAKFQERWKDLQQHLPQKQTWPLAIINADKMVDDALKARRYKGKTMGERLVSAQRDLTANDRIWYAHKMRNKLVHEDYNLTRKNDVKEALLGFLQALKDLGAMPK